MNSRSLRALSVSLVAAAPLFAGTAALGQGQVVGWGRRTSGETPTPVGLQFPLVQLSAGHSHNAALSSVGSVHCWGYNYYGQCNVPAGLGPVVQVDGSFDFTIALKANGTLAGWGLGVPPGLASLTDGVQVDCGLGSGWLVGLRANGTVWSSAGGVLVPPAGLGGVAQVAAGGNHAAARKGDGSVVCWGLNDNGQLNIPSGLTPARGLAAGQNHTVALLNLYGGTVSCWGLNTSGQCTVPPELLGISQIAAGYNHTVALTSAGTVVCWGLNTSGQCTVPAGLTGVTRVAAGEAYTVALQSDGTVKGWGSNSSNQCTAPVTSPFGVTAMDGGDGHSFAVRQDGTSIGWGSNAFGQAATPAGLGTVAQVATGATHTAALKLDGNVACWGWNHYGQCDVPAGLGAVTMVAASQGGSCALLAAGNVVQWGAVGGNPPAGLATVTQIDGGYGHFAARKSNGTAVCWGDNSFFQLNVPPTLVGVMQVAAGWKHTLALKSDGAIVGWGVNSNGQLTVPPGLGLATQVAAGRLHTVALKTDGTVAAWGLNDFGQTTVPPGLGNVTKVAAGDFHTLALLAPSASSCATLGSPGTATLTRNGASWQNVGIWTWSDGGAKVPGLLSTVNLGAYGTVASMCDAQCGQLVARAGTTLILPVNLSIPMSAQPDHSIDVTSTAALAGRIWLYGSGASVLPLDLDIPVLRCGTPIKSFDFIESNVRAPDGWFLTVVPSMSGPQVLYSLRLHALPGGGEAQASSDGTASGRAIAAEVIDVDNDGYDDLAVAINFTSPASGLLQILMNDGAGALGGVSQLYAIPSAQLTSLATGDVNGDGLEEAAVGLAAGAIYNWRNSGEGDMQAPSSFSTNGRIPLSLAIIPRGGSGSGLAMQAGGYTSGSSSGGSKTTTFNESGTQTGEISTNGSTPTTMVGRGRDVATGGSNSATLNPVPGASGRVAVLRIVSDANGNPVPTLLQTIDISGIPALMDMADVDGDGFDEIITANQSPEGLGDGVALPVVTLMRGSASGFGDAIPFAPDGATSGADVSLVDTNNDGIRDIVSVHRTLGTTTKAAIVRLAICRDDAGVPCDSNGATFTVESQTALTDSTQPSFTVRGDLNRQGGDDFYLVDEPPTSALVGGVGSIGRPYLGADFCIGDLDHDSAITTVDLGMVLAAWGTTGESAADFNHDGVVDALDLGTMLGSWGQCN